MRWLIFRMSACWFVIVLIGLSQPTEASAFYWPPWPGSEGGVPTGGPELPPQTFPPITETPPLVVGVPPPEAPSVPEPSTLLGSLLGLGVVACYRKWRKGKSA